MPWPLMVAAILARISREFLLRPRDEPRENCGPAIPLSCRAMHGIAAGRILLSVTLVASLTLAPGGCGPSGDDQAASAALPAAAQPAATAQPAAGHPPVDAPVAQKFAPGEG